MTSDCRSISRSGLSFLMSLMGRRLPLTLVLIRRVFLLKGVNSHQTEWQLSLSGNRWAGLCQCWFNDWIKRWPYLNASPLGCLFDILDFYFYRSLQILTWKTCFFSVWALVILAWYSVFAGFDPRPTKSACWLHFVRTLWRSITWLYLAETFL